MLVEVEFCFQFCKLKISRANIYRFVIQILLVHLQTTEYFFTQIVSFYSNCVLDYVNSNNDGIKIRNSQKENKKKDMLKFLFCIFLDLFVCRNTYLYPLFSFKSFVFSIKMQHKKNLCHNITKKRLQRKQDLVIHSEP